MRLRKEDLCTSVREGDVRISNEEPPIVAYVGGCTNDDLRIEKRKTKECMTPRNDEAIARTLPVNNHTIGKVCDV